MCEADPQTAALVRQTLDELWQAYQARDLAGVLACFAPGDQTMAIGTGADEVATGREAIARAFARDFAQAGEIARLSTGQVSVMARGEVAWLAVEARAEVGGDSFVGRLTAVLLFRGGRWLIAQQHLSLPAPGQSEGQSFPEK